MFLLVGLEFCQQTAGVLGRVSGMSLDILFREFLAYVDAKELALKIQQQHETRNTTERIRRSAPPWPYLLAL